MTGIERLNACFHEFPEQTKALLHAFATCPDGMERHVMRRVLPDGSKVVTLIGLLNGTLFRSGRQLAYEVLEREYPSREAELADIQGYALVPDKMLHVYAPDGAGSWLSAVGSCKYEATMTGLSFEDALPYAREGSRIDRPGWHGEYHAEIDDGELVRKNKGGITVAWTGVRGDVLATDWQVLA